MALFGKKFTSAALAGILALGIAASAEAAGGRDYRPDAQIYGGLSAEQEATARKLFSESAASTAAIRDQLRAKRAELDAQLASPTPNKGKIESLSREIGELRGKLMNARVELRSRLADEGIPGEAFEPAPGPMPGRGPAYDDPGYGPGFGPYGHGYGYGYHHGRGHGPRRGCWFY